MRQVRKQMYDFTENLLIFFLMLFNKITMLSVGWQYMEELCALSILLMIFLLYLF